MGSEELKSGFLYCYLSIALNAQEEMGFAYKSKGPGGRKQTKNIIREVLLNIKIDKLEFIDLG